MKFIQVVFLVFLGMYSGSAQNKWSLEKCVSYAIENNNSVKQSELASQLQETEITRAEMDFYPTVSGSTGVDYGFGKPLGKNSFNNSFGISSGITLYNGNRNKNTLKRAEKNLEISKLNVQKIQDDITLRVVNAYLTILYNQESVKIAKDQIKVGENLVVRMKELVALGTKARNDLFQVEANLATNEERLVTAENNLDLSLLNLAQILQISHKGFSIEEVKINIKTAKLIYSNSDLIYSKSLKLRPEIQSATMNIENANLDIAMAKSGMLPTVSASYRFNTGFVDVQDALRQSAYFKQLVDNRGHSVGVSVQIPIFDKFSTRTNTQRAQIQKEIAEYTLENEKTNLRATIERAFLDAKTSLKTFEATKKSVLAQEEAFRIAQERYDLGVLTSFDFDQVRNQLVNAQSSFIRAKYNFIFRTKFLEFYYGLPIKL